MTKLWNKIQDQLTIARLGSKDFFHNRKKYYVPIIGVSLALIILIVFTSFCLGLESLTMDYLFRVKGVGAVKVKKPNNSLFEPEEVEQILSLAEVDKVDKITSFPITITVGNKKIDTILYAEEEINKDRQISFGAKDKLGIKKIKAQENNLETVITNNLFSELKNDLGETEEKKLTMEFYQTQGENVLGASSIETRLQGVIADKKKGVIVSLEKLKQYKPDVKPTELRVKPKDGQEIKLVANKIRGMRMVVEDNIALLQDVKRLFLVLKLGFATFALISLLLASLGVFNVINITLVEKTRIIALMKIVGAKNKQIILIFITNVFLIVMISTIIGLISGNALVIAINKIFQTLSVKKTGMNLTPLLMPIQYNLIIALITIMAGVIGSFYPLRKVKNIDELKALIYE